MRYRRAREEGVLEFRILGPLEVWRDGCPIKLGAAKQRALLAILLLNANRVVSRDRLADALWGEQPPATAAASPSVRTMLPRMAVGSTASSCEAKSRMAAVI